MTEEWFWRTTPCRLSFLLKRKREQQKQESRRLAEQIALLRADLINFSMGHPKDVVKLADLLPWAKEDAAPGPQSRERKRRMPARKRDEIAQSWRMFLSGQP
jgi:hypothetical protein